MVRLVFPLSRPLQEETIPPRHVVLELKPRSRQRRQRKRTRRRNLYNEFPVETEILESKDSIPMMRISSSFMPWSPFQPPVRRHDYTIPVHTVQSLKAPEAPFPAAPSSCPPRRPTWSNPLHRPRRPADVVGHPIHLHILHVDGSGPRTVDHLIAAADLC